MEIVNFDMFPLTTDILKKAKLSASTSTAFQFFDQTFVVRSDTEEIVRSFRNLFFRFLLPYHNATSDCDYYILSKKNFLGRPLLIVENQNFFLDNDRDLTGFSYMKIMDSVLSKIESHTLFHGASLSYNEQGVIFPAASKSGKSTTAMELVKRGFSFLSDDIAALSLTDYKLYPFPKKIGLLPNTLRLYPEIDSKSLGHFPMLGGGPGKNKMLIDIEEIFNKSLGKPCPLSCLIFLGPAPEKRTSLDKTPRIFIILNRATDLLIEELKQEKGVLDVSVFPTRQKFPVLKIEWEQPFPGLSRIENICYRNESLIYDHSDGRESQPDFSGTPELKKVSKSEAIFQLLKEIKGGQKSAILMKECKGNAARLFIILGQMFKNVDCYYLTPGRLKERTDLVCRLCGL